MPWTDERTEEAIRLFKSGCSAAQIAKRLGGITRNAVLGKLWRLGHKREAPSRPREVATRQKMVRTARAVPTTKPTAVIPANRFDPLPETAPRPWEQRGDGCNWPVGDGLSCCQPVHSAGWCRAHHAIGRVPLKPAQRDLTHALRRHIG